MTSNSNNPESPSVNPSTSSPESPSVNPSTSGSFCVDGILGHSFSSPDLRRGNSSYDSSASWGSASSNTNTSAMLCPAAVTAVAKAKDEMGLLNPATTTFNKLNGVDKFFVEDLIIVEKDAGLPSTRRYTGVNNTCQLSLKRHKLDLSRNVADAETLESTITEEKQALQDLEVATEELRDAYHQSLHNVAEQKVVLEANSDLYKERINDVGLLAKKYAFTEWIQENSEALASATVEEARSFVGLGSKEQVRLLSQHDSVKKLRLLKRLGWDKSDFMVRGFGGCLLIKPRDGKVNLSHDLLIAYLCLAPEEEMKRAALVLHRRQIQPTVTTASGLSAILEDEEGDDPATTAKKRQAREIMEDLMSPTKKRRVN
jgi:hypothetical protein